MKNGPESQVGTPGDAAYRLALLTTCVLSILIVSVDLTAPLHPEVRAILRWIDFVFCGVFFFDFIIQFRAANNKARYMATWGWIDLASCVPAVAFLRFGRFARLIRLIQALRVLRSARTLVVLLKHYRARATGIFASAIVLIAVALGSTLVLTFELRSPSSQIRSAEEALWWAFVTMTTVGYGDEYPTTLGGRIVAIVMMSLGVGVFGAVSALLASWIIGPGDSREIRELRRDSEAIRASLRSLEDKIELIAQRHTVD